MRLDDLVADARTSLDESIKEMIDRPAFRDDMNRLGRYAFWTNAENRPHLWDHQKAAIGTVVAYLNGDKSIPERPDHIEAALLKLPTGTGKSGIIAVVARCLPRVRKVLVLTPREALTKQLLRDVQYRFWGHIGYHVQESQLFAATAETIGAELQAAYTDTFLPSHCNDMFTHLNEADRVVLVGTHQALDKIRRAALDDDDASAGVCKELLHRIKETFQLIIVDEGHYEPAISWSRGVREFNLPTILLSATPYRNDYKSFRVRGRYLFNYPYADAVTERIIRPVEIVVPAADPRTLQGAAAVKQFVQLLKTELPPRLEATARWFGDEDTLPKVMIRGDELDKLISLQTAIDETFETKSVVIHDRAEKTEQNKNLFNSVSSATQARPHAQFWIHQFKLMEGIDDPSFVAVAIFDLMGNARQLVQQIGRVTRHSNGDGRVKQTGWVLATSANIDRIQTSWKRYVAYEGYAANNARFIVSNEVTLPDRLLELMAEYQYIGGEFRRRFELEAPLAAEDIQLPQSAAVLKADTRITDIAEFATFIEEAILDKDRFKITPIAGLPSNMMGFSYYAWRNTPLLVDRFFSEWRFGIFIAVHYGEFVFMHDTEGLVVDVEKLGLKRADRSLMEKAFPEQDDANTTRLSRLSFSSLEMSQNAIRGMAVRTRSFADVFTDLLDPSLVPATAFGFVNGRARYLGFVRSRIREGTERYVGVQEYLKWTAQVALELNDDDRTRNSVFGRYAQVVAGLPPEEASPTSILLDFSRDAFIDTQDDEATAAQAINNEEPEYDELCADVDPITHQFQIKIAGADVPCSIEYRESTGTYRIESEKLNELFPPKETENRRQRQTIVQRLNHDQAFRVIVQNPAIVYSEGRFYKPRLRWTVEGGGKPILDSVIASLSLENVTAEKGEGLYDTDRNGWYRKSIFGLFSAVCEQRLGAIGIADDDLTRAIAGYSIWLCDDDNRESADFIGINEDEKRIVLVHAKMGKQGEGGTGFNVTSLQEVGRQVLASLAFISRGEPSPVWSSSRWESDVQANVVPLEGRNRIFKSASSLSAAQLNERLVQATQNPSFDKETWIVSGKAVRKAALIEGLDAEPRENRLRQFLMHWDALQTACARASVRLRLFCD